MSSLLPVAVARARLLQDLRPVGAERLAVAAAVGRVLAADLSARVARPPLAMSAMDGYAVRSGDVAAVPADLTLIGRAAAGHPFAGCVETGQAVRIFTGGVIPAGADAVVIQENTVAARDGLVRVLEPVAPGSYVRPAGSDFAEGAVLVSAGRRLTPRDIGLAAAMNLPWLTVRRRVRVAYLSTGDEVVAPGEPIGPGALVSGTGPSIGAFLAAQGVDATDLGTAPDNTQALRAMVDGARGADLLITLGGVSVGDADLVVPALTQAGFALDFHRVAVRPGKPLLFGHLGAVPVVGLSGNSVSAYIAAVLFIEPMLCALQGLPTDPPPLTHAVLTAAVAANDLREDYLRARLDRDGDGRLRVTPFPVQDSAQIATLAAADALVIRPAFAPAAAAGTEVPIIDLADRLM